MVSGVALGDGRGLGHAALHIRLYHVTHAMVSGGALGDGRGLGYATLHNYNRLYHVTHAIHAIHAYTARRDTQ